MPRAVYVTACDRDRQHKYLQHDGNAEDSLSRGTDGPDGVFKESIDRIPRTVIAQILLTTPTERAAYTPDCGPLVATLQKIDRSATAGYRVKVMGRKYGRKMNEREI